MVKHDKVQIIFKGFQVNSFSLNSYMWKYAIDSCRKIHLAKFPTTTEFIADTSPKDSPADLRCALHLLLFGHLYSVLTRCDPLISLHFSPLQRKENIRPRRSWTSPSQTTVWVKAAFIAYRGTSFCVTMAVQPATGSYETHPAYC